MKLTNALHLLLSLRMSGGIPLLLLYASTSWKRKILAFYFALNKISYEKELLKSANFYYLTITLFFYGKFHIYYGETPAASERAQV